MAHDWNDVTPAMREQVPAARARMHTHSFGGPGQRHTGQRHTGRRRGQYGHPLWKEFGQQVPRDFTPPRLLAPAAPRKISWPAEAPCAPRCACSGAPGLRWPLS
jgi:hypothetical protein